MSRSQPISQVEIENELIRVVERIEDETEAFERLAQDHAEKEAAFKSAWYFEYLHTDGTVKNRECWAGFKTGKLYEDVVMAEALVKAKREKLHSLRTACDALRTLSANVRSQVKY